MRNKTASSDDFPSFVTEPTSNVPWCVVSVEPLSDYNLNVQFLDGTQGMVMMERRIYSENAGIFASLRDESLFRQVTCQYGEVMWPSGLDLAPDAMHDAILKDGKWVLE